MRERPVVAVIVGDIVIGVIKLSLMVAVVRDGQGESEEGRSVVVDEERETCALLTE